MHLRCRHLLNKHLSVGQKVQVKQLKLLTLVEKWRCVKLHLRGCRTDWLVNRSVESSLDSQQILQLIRELLCVDISTR